MEQLQICTVTVGEIETNCYLVSNKQTKEIVVIDPGAEAQTILREIAVLGGRVTAILLTHGHGDHIGAAEEIRQAYGVPVVAGSREQELLGNEKKNVSLFLGAPVTITADYLAEDKEILPYLNNAFQVLYTPGHTAGGVCYYASSEALLFSGDTLFAGSVGRTNFPTGDRNALAKSIKEILFALPEETDVYPGHGQMTTIGIEKQQ